MEVRSGAPKHPVYRRVFFLFRWSLAVRLTMRYIFRSASMPPAGML